MPIQLEYEAKTMLQFIPIDQDHWRYALQVSDEQKAFVSDEKGILARAFAHRNWNVHCCVLQAERSAQEEAAFRKRMLDAYGMEFPENEKGVPVGLILYYDLPEEGAYYLAQLLIDQKYQYQGYGKEAVASAVDQLRKEKRYDKVLSCVLVKNKACRAMLEHMGWTLTDDSDPERDEELLYELTL